MILYYIVFFEKRQIRGWRGVSTSVLRGDRTASGGVILIIIRLDTTSSNNSSTSNDNDNNDTY